MKVKKAGNHILLVVISFINLFWFVTPVFSQEGDEPLKAWKWYYYQRAYPFDTIPWSAYERAVDQRDALLQSTGYQFSAPLRWEHIGPLPYAAGTFSGRIAHVVYDKLDPNEDGSGRVIYVTGASGGLWKTIDGGVNWQNKSGNLPTLSAGAFAISYVNDNKILYFGSGQWNQFWGDGMGMRIFKSTDDGNTWTPIGNGLRPGTSINKIAIKPNDPNTIFAATFHGLYKTTDGGGLWTKIIPRPEDPIQELICSDVCFSPSGNKVYAVGPSSGRGWPWNVFDGIGFFRSDDGGNNFAPITNTGFPHSNVLTATTLCAVSKAPAPGAEDLVWFLSYDDDYAANGYVYKSTNYGQSFTSMIVGSNHATKYHLSLRASDADMDICYAGNMYLHRTTNGGTSWVCVGGYCGMHADVKGMDINPFFPNKITEGNDGGVFRSDNSGSYGSWFSCNQNLGSLSLLWGLASSTYDANFVAGGLHDFSSFSYNPDARPGSTYWSAAIGGGGDCGNVKASPFKSKHFVSNILVGNQNIYYSSNGTYFEGANGYASSSTYSIEVEPFTYHPEQPGVVYTVRFNGVWQGTQQVQFRKSLDHGATWGGDEPWQSWRLFQRPNDWDATAPTNLAISQSNPNTMIMSFGNGSEFWLGTYDARSRLIKSIDGGLTWEGIDNNTDPIVTGGFNGTPNRFFTDVEFDPKDPNSQEVYLTVSGYYPPSEPNGGHVFKSIDGGYNWENISGNLPDIPVNDLMIHYTGSGEYDKELIIATDAGIYSTNATYIGWGEIATYFPKSPALHLDYNRLSGKLRANTWGRGAWEFQLDGTVYVQDHLYITDDVTLNLPIVVCPGGKLILGHQDLPDPIDITFENSVNIVVMNGGEIDASTGNAINLSSNGTWSGIEIQGNGYGTMKNCVFNNTETPITINSGRGGGSNILIDNCTFNNGSVTVNGRDNVTISKCITNTASASTGTGISANYCDNLVLSQNTINNAWAAGIMVSNSSPVILSNVINHAEEINSAAGISLDNCYSGTLNYNQIYNYNNGFYLYYSSPSMLENISISNTTSMTPDPSALYANYLSSPRLKPTYGGGGEIIWDAGLNELKMNTQGNGIFMWNLSIPNIDYGYNKIHGADYHLAGWIGDPWQGPIYTYYARNNCWEPAYPPLRENILDADVIDDPYICEPPGVGGKSNDDPEMEEQKALAPPPPIIVNYGNGIFDTIKVSNGNLPMSNDQLLFSQGLDAEIDGNYQLAISKHTQVVQNYQDSSTSVNAMKKILYCYDKLHSLPNVYTTLRTYYQNLASQNPTDTGFVQAAREMASKCLVRMSEYPSAITEYEAVVQSSNDSLEILCAELNIIETYMIIEQGSDAPGFTGQIQQLKPASVLDGIRMINEKLHRIKPNQKDGQIPVIFKLSQNYPNPFNPLTKIDYSIPKRTNVTLKVYDILGRLVKTLVNEFKDVGIYTVQFDGTGLSSGVYFYTIEAGNFNASKKMVLIK